MGDGKRKKDRFKAEHPWCCFCGGERPATTIDHIPARTCFRNREYPDGFEFPACATCQEASRKDEIVFAFYTRALDHNDDNLAARDFDRLINGLLNNMPELAPRGMASRNAKRETLRRMGLKMTPGYTLDQAPIVSFDPTLHQHIIRYARKIACALYYREQGRPALLTHRTLATWGQESDPTFLQRHAGFYNMTPLQTIGRRPNVDIGDQFRYQCNKADEPDVFAAVASFGRGGMTLSMIVVSQDFAEKLDRQRELDGSPEVEPWVPVAEIYPS